MPRHTTLLLPIAIGAVAAAGLAAAFFTGNAHRDAAPKLTPVRHLEFSSFDEDKALSNYARYCLSCHGNGTGKPNGGSLVDGVWNHGDSVQAKIRAIADGLPEHGMPEFGSVLSDTEVRDLVALMDRPELLAAAGETDDSEPRSGRRTTRHYFLNIEEFARGYYSIPWAIHFLDERRALVTERPGALRLIVDGWLHPDPIAGTPDVLARGQGGMMDVAADPDFENNGWIYLTYSDAGARGASMTRLVRGKIVDHTWTDEEVLWEARADDYVRTGFHYGTRIVFDDEGYLYFTIGDRGQQSKAQDLTKPNGKVFRLRTDGSVPEDNPFVDQPGAYDAIFSYGHRNIQGMSIHPETGDVWTTEHGPRGGDEVNRIQLGKNYGWPVITYGINYNGSIITHQMRADGMEQPNYYWEPSIAVCGIEFCDGTGFAKWANDLIVTGLVTEDVRRLVIDGDRVMHDELIIDDMGRVRDVGFDPAGAMYIVTNDPDRILKVTNAGPAQRR